jgi:dihydrofolate reductase
LTANIQLIWAQDLNGGIGFNNHLLFNVPEDLKFFSQTTRDNIILMGRKTWDSLPKKPLPSRRNIVLSRNLKTLEGAEVYSDFDEAIHSLDGTVWVIGGETLYKEAITKASTLYITQIFKEATQVDAYGPRKDYIDNHFDLVNSTDIKTSEKTNINYAFYHYIRKEN